MITRKDLEDYILIKKHIQETKRKIAYYSKKYPYAIHGKVKGSSPDYPYIERNYMVDGGGFSSGGMNNEKIRQRIKNLTYKLQDDLREYESKRVEIEEFLLGIDNLEAHLLFTYIFVDGRSQEEAGEMMNMEQSCVSKKLKKYIRAYIPESNKTQDIV